MGPIFFEKGISGSKKKKEHHYRIQHIRISLRTTFHLQIKIFNFLNQICPKRVFPVQNRGLKHRHRISHIRINLGTKFHLKKQF